MQESIRIAGIYDLAKFPWGRDIFEFTIEKLRAEYGYEDLTYDLADGKCDETSAVRGYWDLRTNNVPVHGIVGARCSGASVSLARIAGLEQVTQVSPASTSSRLSNKEEFPFFSRMVAPDDSRGEVGALVSTLRWFGWQRVTILSTDTLYAKDYVNEFRKLWEGDHWEEAPNWTGEIAYSNIIRLDANGSLDTNSVNQALAEVPTDDPTVNSRIVLLIAQSQHAAPILKIASDLNFQPDTVWVGTSSWIANDNPTSADSLSWEEVTPGYPSYFGLAQPGSSNETFKEDFSTWRLANQKPPMEPLPTYAAEMVDSIIALARALYSVPVNDRRDGYKVRTSLRNLDFSGASGRVQFTELGDRQDPRYAIMQLKKSSSDGSLAWRKVGDSGIERKSTSIMLSEMCFPGFGCNLLSPPLDAYPEPPDALEVWVFAVIIVLVFMFIAVAIKYWRSRKSKKGIKAELESFRDSVVGMRTAESTYIPYIGNGTARNGAYGRLSGSENVQWCWKETSMVMNNHDPSEIVGDPVDCWIKYDVDANSKLELAFQEQGKSGSFSPLKGYIVDFGSMNQTKASTGFVRDIQRLASPILDNGDKVQGGKSESMVIKSKGGKVISFVSKGFKGEPLPNDLKGEPQMVLVPGDVVQISKQSSDANLAFGTKLYHADEQRARNIVASIVQKVWTLKNSEEEYDINHQSGWFCLDATRTPTAEDLTVLKENIGDADALNAPSNWSNIADPTVVQAQELKKDDPERQAVVSAFKSSVGNSGRVKIESVKRVENLAMWQGYVVKRQTICYRETAQRSKGKNSPNSDDAIHRRALQRFERHWLWHGTNIEVMDKILQQGFNRSFCGKNATVYGKGVYFARDSSYSSSKTYAVPDSEGYQYVMACRVVVGEYCPGVHNALTPDIRDPNTHTLYDSTVGILQGDTFANPSIYVTYHDAQSYPEYLIRFRQY